MIPAFVAILAIFCALYTACLVLMLVQWIQERKRNVQNERKGKIKGNREGTR